ncbi:MAG: metabolite traffic protein EboE [Planctomycetes bacterium]|nr:metabolite traffic protein EboE [Planctomycetota bacterium]
MRLNDPSRHLTYCLNVHPGENWAPCLENIKTQTLAVREAVCPAAPFGLGLRLSHQAAQELAVPETLAAFKQYLADQSLYVFTINGFPYGTFHGSPVKQAVYRPDWRQPERLAYTTQLADILAALLPEGIEGSISTVPASYKSWITSEADRQAMLNNLANCADHLADLEASTGREIHLGLEPEPDCYIETTAESVVFLLELFEAGALQLAKARGLSLNTAETLLRRHIGICFDTCHLALQYEDLTHSLLALQAAEIRLSKVQLSAALHTNGSEASRGRLAEFNDPVYLHQVKTRQADGRIVAYPDLPDALASRVAEQDTWRVHCHIPLYYSECNGIGTTADLLTPELMSTLFEASHHLEIETYTFDVLPPDMRGRGVRHSIIEEFKWVQARHSQPK